MVVIATLLILVVGTLFGLLAYLVVPGRKNVPIWVAILMGMAAMVLGSLLANLFGVGDAQGIDWIELLIQLALAVVGVAIVANLRSRRRVS
ncbi:GlsB/YeaQ/YmgE family stress response membrane protein [Micromonospora sp. IBHARD004]|uniref:GlsB/YeaQ/YmgE family stress response membrane protein n=1 Tax=Micromonospora sp. IBHARD004 TaxID=3457764 RepID=UPI004059CE7F